MSPFHQNPPRRPWRAAARAGLAAALLLPGCRYLPSLTGPAEPPPPSVSDRAGVDAAWRLETRPIGGSPVARAAGAAADAPEFRARVRLVEVDDPDALPEPELPAWIFARAGSDPLEPAPRFTAGAEAGWLAEPLDLDAAPRAEAEVPLGPGAGWSLAPRAKGGEAIELLLWSEPSGALGAALAASGRVPRLELNESQRAAIGALGTDLVEGRDGLEVAPLPAANGRRSLWARVPTSGARALVLVVTAEPAPTEGAEGLAHAREIADVRRAFDDLHDVPEIEPLLGLARDDASRRRALLVELARSTNRPLATDLVLFADDATLERWVRAATSQSVPKDRFDQSWALERAALLDQAREADAGQHAPSLAAVLRVHLGPLGTEPALLGDTVRRSKGPRTFAEKLVAETELLLTDPRPAVRVRASRWLTERGLGPATTGPEAFDPLADRTARRAALDAWRRAQAAEGATR